MSYFLCPNVSEAVKNPNQFNIPLREDDLARLQLNASLSFGSSVPAHEERGCISRAHAQICDNFQAILGIIQNPWNVHAIYAQNFLDASMSFQSLFNSIDSLKALAYSHGGRALDSTALMPIVTSWLKENGKYQPLQLPSDLNEALDIFFEFPLPCILGADDPDNPWYHPITRTHFKQYLDDVKISRPKHDNKMAMKEENADFEWESIIITLCAKFMWALNIFESNINVVQNLRNEGILGPSDKLPTWLREKDNVFYALAKDREFREYGGHLFTERMRRYLMVKSFPKFRKHGIKDFDYFTELFKSRSH